MCTALHTRKGTQAMLTLAIVLGGARVVRSCRSPWLMPLSYQSAPSGKLWNLPMGIRTALLTALAVALSFTDAALGYRSDPR